MTDNRFELPAIDDRNSLPRGFEGFHNLMQKRILDILLVASMYDEFVFEGDGHLSELILTEYIELNLRFAPRVHRVSSADEALRMLSERRFDLVLTMSRIQDMDAFSLGRSIKRLRPDMPVVLLTYNPWELDSILEKDTTSGIDYIFAWQGDLRVLVAIIKLLEDRMNAEVDVLKGGVQAIILIEDSVRFYSSYLPLIYSEIVKQTLSLMGEVVNTAQRIMRQCARPKILLAVNYEQAIEYYEKYKKNLLGIISDVAFCSGGIKDWQAGLNLISMAKSEIPDIPAALQSADVANRDNAEAIGAHFIYKNSPSLLSDLRTFIKDNFGFGDFVFRSVTGEEVARASDIKSLVDLLPSIPDESFLYHAGSNHFSIWLKARTEFEIAGFLRPIKPDSFATVSEAKAFIANVLTDFRRRSRRSVVVDFSSESFDDQTGFARIGSGTLGGKAHNLAFINRFLDRHKVPEELESIRFRVPRSQIIATDVFDEFLELNELQKTPYSELKDNELGELFLSGTFPDWLLENLSLIVDRVRYPLAVRSSSLIEDSQYLPFAGVYATIMLPNNHRDPRIRLTQLTNAIKTVYASTFHENARRYLSTTPSSSVEEKMAVIVQELVGLQHDEYFYPEISGVARSYNYYPLGTMKQEDGIVSLALGLGKFIVDGGNAWRFSPKYPRSLPPFASPSQLADVTQRSFYALNLHKDNDRTVFKQQDNLEQLDLQYAERHGTLTRIGSTYSPDEDRIFDGTGIPGQRIVTFAHILKNAIIPLARFLEHLLDIGSNAMGAPVEIEFAVNLPKRSGDITDFWLLQIRQHLSSSVGDDTKRIEYDESSVAIRSQTALGEGIIDCVTDIVYIKPDAFTPEKTKEIASELRQIDERIGNENRKYVLAGPGRWGSSDPWLGIPVVWSDIHNAKVIVEVILDNFRCEPSQGSHFFHNLIALQIGYMTVNGTVGDDLIDWKWLDSHEQEYESTHIRHIRLRSPLTILLDGRRGKAVVLKPVEDNR